MWEYQTPLCVWVWNSRTGEMDPAEPMFKDSRVWAHEKKKIQPENRNVQISGLNGQLGFNVLRTNRIPKNADLFTYHDHTFFMSWSSLRHPLFAVGVETKVYWNIRFRVYPSMISIRIFVLGLGDLSGIVQHIRGRPVYSYPEGVWYSVPTQSSEEGRMGQQFQPSAASSVQPL